MKLKSTATLTALMMVIAVLTPSLVTAVSAQEIAADESRFSYIVLMDAEPLLEYEGGVDDLAATAVDDGERPDPRSEAAQEYRGHLIDLQNEAISSIELRPKQILNRYHYTIVGFSAMLTESEADELRRRDGIAHVQRDVLYELADNEGPEDGEPTLPNDNENNTGFTGDGVVVGVIDTGIWPEHPSFSDDGSYNEPPETWTTDACSFGAKDYNPDDVDFECNNKVIGARNVRATYTELLGSELYHSARDYTGHGTQAASIAAGNSTVMATVLGEEVGPISGMAPRAHLAAYSACGDLGCYASDVTAAVDRAVADGVDVISYSTVGGADAVSPVGLSFLKATSVGVSVATAAGNSGPEANTVGEPATDPWVTTVGANTQGPRFAAEVTIDGRSFVGATVTEGTEELAVVDGAERGNPRCDPSVAFEPALSGEIVLCARGAVQRTAKSQAVLEQGGGGMILFNQNDAQGLVTDSHVLPTIHVGFEAGNTIREMIATAEGEITATMEKQGRRPGPDPAVPAFSSRGPNPVTGDILKPDVSAPGANILTATTPTPITGTAEELFQTGSGTSMSSPHVAGIMALLIEAHPDWSPAAIKSALMTTAAQNLTSGRSGKPAGAFARGSGAVEVSRSLFEPEIVFDIDPSDYTGYLCEGAMWALGEDTCNQAVEDDELVTVEDLNLPSIAIDDVIGTTTVSRTMTNVTDETVSLSADVASPEGVDIEVAPDELTIRGGESETFEVTIKVDGDAERDVWATGSISWTGDDQDGGSSAHMPVVVRPLALQTPASVTGGDGEAELPLRFGYDGDFETTAHGLVEPEKIASTVVQDETPEGSPRFDPADVEKGATVHEVELADTAHLRLTLSGLTLPEGTSETEIDLDLFIYDSKGNRVASSTEGGTDEIIDLSFPDDDTYTIYVHGWATGDDEIEYDLRSWVVPTASDGTLVVDEAPTSASIGDESTIRLEWTGDDDANRLGVVSYEGPDGLLDVTLVEVPAP